MPSLTDSISSVQEQVLDLIKTAQDPTVDAVEKVVETVEGIIPADRPSLPFVDSLPNPAESIDKAFGFAEQLVDGQHDFVKALLANQRDFAKAIVDAVAPLLPTTPAKPAKPVAATKATKAA
jgi:tetrahydromethanopterin S-methyltransferase subunit B